MLARFKAIPVTDHLLENYEVIVGSGEMKIGELMLVEKGSWLFHASTTGTICVEDLEAIVAFTQGAIEVSN